MRYHMTYPSPIGKLHILTQDDAYVERIILVEEEWETYSMHNVYEDDKTPLGEEVVRQLVAYFAGDLRTFKLPIQQTGTPFQKSVWQALAQIPYGQVYSYQDVAVAIGNPKAVRAIGQANRANSLPLIIPCHRVVGKDGKMVGYCGAHQDKKLWLLQHEGGISDDL